MNPMLTLAWKLWDLWNLRTLVLLSLILQIILSIFGNRRKYISSPWIYSVLVWLAYLMADWVATVTLGKLSDALCNSENINVLWAIWAPLLLLHLGGPDGITAFSLEDNQLWMRHLMRLGAQLFVAIYVIIMSWKNSWFSFMSLPALVAGIIKYGERTWVLKSVSDEKYLESTPLGKVGDYKTEGDEYLRDLVLAYSHLEDFLCYLEKEGRFVRSSPYPRSGENNIECGAAEVCMGLVYDLLYTKVSRVYSKSGCVLRCISFGCTVTALVGLIFRIAYFREDYNRKGERLKIDIAITAILLIGALTLEIYAAVAMFSSNWFMLWLIKQGKKEWVIWLSQRFPFLFKTKKNWSKMMGQFDLLGYSLKVGKTGSPSRRIIRAVLGPDYEHKWIRYRHKTAYSVHPLVYNVVLEYSKPWSRSRIPNITTDEWAEFSKVIDPSCSMTMRFDFQSCIMSMHHVTEICYHLEMEWVRGEDHSGSDSASLWEQNRKVSKALSDYMMYLLVMQPSLLPDVGYSRRGLENTLRYPQDFIGNAREVKEACHYLLKRRGSEWSMVVQRLKVMEKPKRWEIIKLMWWRVLQNTIEGAAGFGQKNGHFQNLTQGGELLTFIWFCYSPPYPDLYFRH